jgi:GntR family transcriptional regulator
MITVQLNSPVPLVDQIALGIRRLIACGELAPGNELPPVRQLAADLGINLNTVARAYRALEEDGLVSSQRGRGTHVTASAETRRGSAADNRQRVRNQLRDALADAKLAGLDRPAVDRLLTELLGEFWPAATD